MGTKSQSVMILGQALMTLEKYVINVIMNYMKGGKLNVTSSQTLMSFSLNSVFIIFKEIMVGTEYQAEVPSCLCHYRDGEKGDCCFFCNCRFIMHYLILLIIADLSRGSNP